MPPAEDIYRHLLGAFRMMTGKRDGLRLLDLSLDGFWNSFFAIVVALPAMLASWVPLAGDLTAADASFGLRLSMLVRLALVDVGAWVLPLAALAAVADYAGIRHRFVHYVVATNWGSAIFAWMTLPVSLIRLAFPASGDLAAGLSLIVFVATLVLYWRLTNAALEKGAGTASAVFGGMLVASLLTLFALQDILGVAPA
ncbi:MAG: transporter [Aquamicrobium sp.]|uniref:transporter n=1 Tax=Aquamicrobium sp. TaxID=1872579 RepID=UPI00349ECCA5|nr:transporter [Aquamicrobium sp.]